MIKVTNRGQQIESTNYWESEFAERGLIWCSVNAGAIRVLLPASLTTFLADMRPATYCIVSRGPWPEQQALEAIEIMWEDESDSPFAFHLTPESFDMLPGDPGKSQWIVSVWTAGENGKPLKQFEHPCHWRRAPKLPWMRPL